MKEFITSAFVTLLIIISIFLFFISICEIDYFFSTIFNQAKIQAICDDTIFFNGDARRFDFSIISENNNLPVYKLKVRGKINVFETDSEAVCKQLRVENIGGI